MHALQDSLAYCLEKWFGDGNISAFRIKDGYVDFKQKYVRTEKFVKERKARRALLGLLSFDLLC